MDPYCNIGAGYSRFFTAPTIGVLKVCGEASTPFDAWNDRRPASAVGSEAVTTSRYEELSIFIYAMASEFEHVFTLPRNSVQFQVGLIAFANYVPLTDPSAWHDSCTH